MVGAHSPVEGGREEGGRERGGREGGGVREVKRVVGGVRHVKPFTLSIQSLPKVQSSRLLPL